MEGNYDIAVVGGGIVGLATGRALRAALPQASLLLLEKESSAGRHQTAHNSGVIHAGLYYAPGSLKARLCAEGRAALLEFCAEQELPVDRCGKLVVAAHEGELEPLRELERRGRANGIEGLEWIEGDRIRELEPAISGLAALVVPTTAITDFGRICIGLAETLRAGGVELQMGQPLIDAQRAGDAWTLQTPGGSYRAQRVIACAGLQSDRVASALGFRSRLRILPFRGEYYRLSANLASRVRRCIYPVPDPSLPFLGVHLTPTLAGDMMVGPNAIFAMAREGYRRWDVSLRDLISAAGFEGSWRLLWRHRRAAWDEMRRAASREATAADLRRLLPAATAKDLIPAPCGIRAQAVDTDGSLVHDFAIEENEHAMAVLNAPSPAATASLAIGRELAARAQRCWSL